MCSFPTYFFSLDFQTLVFSNGFFFIRLFGEEVN